jgi:phage gpG-like protein
MAVSTTLNVKGLDEATKKLADVEKRARDLSPVLRGRAETLRSEILLGSFGASQSPAGDAWQPLAESTVKRRRQGSSKPLIDTGALRGAVTTRADNKSVFFGVSGAPGVYAGAQNFGHEQIPARPFLPTDSSGTPYFGGSGWAAKWWKTFRERVERYVLTGRV